MRLDVSTDEGYQWAEQNARFRLDHDAPIDLCFSCAMVQGIEHVTDQDHPPYEDWEYRCVVCKEILTDEDE